MSALEALIADYEYRISACTHRNVVVAAARLERKELVGGAARIGMGRLQR